MTPFQKNIVEIILEHNEEFIRARFVPDGSVLKVAEKVSAEIEREYIRSLTWKQLIKHLMTLLKQI